MYFNKLFSQCEPDTCSFLLPRMRTVNLVKSVKHFIQLIGSNTHYGWTDEGPDLQAMFRNSRAGRTWHA